MRVVNAVCDPVNALITVYEQVSGGVQRRQVRGEYVSYLDKRVVTRDLLRMLRGSRHVLGILQEGEWVRVSWRTRSSREQACDPKEGWFAKQHIPTYEADVNPLRRWMADDSTVQVVAPRRVYLDIETDARAPMLRKEEQRILCWALVDAVDARVKSGVLSADTDAGERALLMELWQALDAYDQVLAWNGDRFDFPMIFTRSKLRRISMDSRRWLWLDHLELFRRFNVSADGDEKQSMALQNVSMNVLKEGKLPGLDMRQNFATWAGGGEPLAKLVEYNARDAQLMQRIEEKTGYVELHQTLCEATCVLPDTYGLQPMPQVEQFMLRLGRERGVHFVTRSREYDENREGFKGAFVMKPTVTGIARDVHVVDFSAMYPSIILSWNMSPETLREHEPEPVLPAYLSHLRPESKGRPEGMCEAPSGVLFANEPRGILALALEELLRMRKAWSEKAAHLAPGSPAWTDAMRRSTSYKIAANSFFGVIGAPTSRLYEQSVAASITGVARWLIESTLKESKAWDLKAIYGDTDSGFLHGSSDARVREFVAHCNDVLYPRLTKEQGCTRNAVKLAYEKKFERVVFVSGKHYIGRYAHYKGEPANEESKPEVKGLEYKRGDTVRVSRRFQAEIIDLLMGGGVEMPPVGEEPGYKTVRREHCAEQEGDFVALVEQYRKLVLEGALTLQDIMQSKKLTRPLKEYAQKKKADGTDAAQPPHVRVAKMMEQRGEGVGEGSRIEYFVLDGVAKTVLPVSDWTGEFDRYDLWEAHVWPASERLLSAAFPEADWSGYARARPRGRAGTPLLAAIASEVTRAHPSIATDAKKAPSARKVALDTGQLGLFSLADPRPRH